MFKVIIKDVFGGDGRHGQTDGHARGNDGGNGGKAALKGNVLRMRVHIQSWRHPSELIPVEDFLCF